MPSPEKPTFAALANGQGTTPGQLAYEEDVRRWPTYPGGKARIAWERLPDFARASWERDPTPRDWREA